MHMDAIILAAGKPFQGQRPSALSETGGDEGRETVVGWQVSILQDIVREVGLVTGYRHKAIEKQFHDLPLFYNPDWSATGPAESLAFGLSQIQDMPKDGIIISYGDIVFSRHAFEEFVKACKQDAITIAVDKQWQNRFENRPADDIAIAEKVILDGDDQIEYFMKGHVENLEPPYHVAEYAGFCHIPAALVPHIEMSEARSFITLFNALRGKNIAIQSVDIGNEWAEMNHPEDLSRFVLSSKAETLKKITPVLKHSSTVEQFDFSVALWQDQQNQLIDNIQKQFAGETLIVRSSAVGEDSFDESAAGKFLSILNVPANDSEKLYGAIDAVLGSYQKAGRPLHAQDQILVQPMLKDVVLSGVITTRTLNAGLPYITINYSLGQDTEAVTSGLDATKTVYLYWPLYKENKHDIALPEELEGVDNLFSELMARLGHGGLDIEFAKTSDGKYWLLQTRPIITPPIEEAEAQAISEKLQKACEKYEGLSTADLDIHGKKLIFGNMPDWNPAEIIGTRPKPLAMSLYKKLIMDEIWATSRAEMGYKPIKTPLLYDFAGQPYVNVTASFNSFIPENISGDLADRLVNHYQDKLENHPESHDKIEFDIALTCYSYDVDQKLADLQDKGFKTEELTQLKEGLLKINQTALCRLDDDFARIQKLRAMLPRYHPDFHSQNLPDLIENIKQYGTLPFSNLARAGFIASSLLRSFVANGIIEMEDVGHFMQQIETVASNILSDGAKVASNEMSYEAYRERYGHLRPGTYEITSSNYFDNHETYLKPLIVAGPDDEDGRHKDFFGVPHIREKLQALIDAGDWRVSLDDLKDFITRAIQGREYAKFIFTRGLNLVLTALKNRAAQDGFSIDDIAYLEIDDLLKETPREHLKEKIAQAKQAYRLTHHVELPSILFSKKDMIAFTLQKSDPNFIGKERLEGEAIYLAEESQSGQTDIRHKIVIIEKADPGFDWIFGWDIKGLVTCYGGANSHMAIRCAELGLPAAIGVGVHRFETLKDKQNLVLDPVNKIIRERG